MKLRTFSIAFVLAVVSFTSITAQDDKIDGLAFDSEPLREEKAPYFAIAGGYTGSFFYANFEDLNSLIKNGTFNMSEGFSAPIYMSGVQGFTGIVIVPNMRAGFHSQSGSLKMEKAFNIEGADYKRTVDYAVSMNGITIDYAITIAKSLAIIPGVTAGWGNLSLETYQAPSELDWSNFQPNSDGKTFLQRAEAGFWLVQPNLNIEFALTNFFMLRANAGYSLSIMRDWKMNKSSTLKNVPEKINGNGLHLQFGIFLGLFNY